MLIFEILAAVWFFVLGSIIGSFINVVVHRTPRGQSILGSSRCPRCRAAIRWHDNVPIVGWFLLRGRCRDCGQPISFRYPVVEFVAACLFLVLAIAELYSGGANLPHRTPGAPPGFAGVVADADWPLLRMYALHSLLAAALFCWALIRVDGNAIPRAQMLGMWTVVYAAAVLWPDVHPLRWSGEPAAAVGQAAYGDGIRNAFFGLLAGSGIALAWCVLNRARGGQQEGAAAVGGFGAIGIALGWQAVLSILFITALSRGVWAVSAIRRPQQGVPMLMDAMVATVVHIAFWHHLWQIAVWPGAGGVYANLAGLLIAVAVLTGTERLPRASEEPRSNRG